MFTGKKNIENYIVDFYIPSSKIVIEIDGRQHCLEENRHADLQRDSLLNSLGIKVLRYSNKSINSNFNAVCNDILKQLNLSANDLKK